MSVTLMAIWIARVVKWATELKDRETIEIRRGGGMLYATRFERVYLSVRGGGVEVDNLAVAVDGTSMESEMHEPVQ